MSYKIVQANKSTGRSLVQSDEGNYGLVNKVYEENTVQDIPESRIWAMPSLLFGIACLYEENLQEAITNLEANRNDSKWSY